MILSDGNGLAKKSRDINGGDVGEKITKDMEKELVKDFERVGYRK